MPIFDCFLLKHVQEGEVKVKNTRGRHGCTSWIGILEEIFKVYNEDIEQKVSLAVYLQCGHGSYFSDWLMDWDWFNQEQITVNHLVSNIH